GLGLPESCEIQVRLFEGKALRLSLEESPFCSIGSEADVLPYYEISGELDAGETLRNVILIQEKYMAENFPSTLLVLGGVGLAVHYVRRVGSALRTAFKIVSGVPLIMAYGKPVSGKSTAIKLQWL
ncbi:Hypothetical predicted protein, partial [Paramuricea clavata]